MSKCKAAKPKKMSRPTKQTWHFPGFRYFTFGHSLGLVSFFRCQSQATLEIVWTNIFIKATQGSKQGIKKSATLVSGTDLLIMSCILKLWPWASDCICAFWSRWLACNKFCGVCQRSLPLAQKFEFKPENIKYIHRCYLKYSFTYSCVSFTGVN